MANREVFPENSTHRLEIFSDGVFAIAITLLILEIKVPHVEEGKNLASELLSLWPSYFGYVFSFLMIGIYWVNHHLIFRLYERVDRVFLFLNLFFLMCIGFLPFPTAVLAEHIDNPSERHTAILLYAVALFLPAFAWLLKWLYASRKGGQLLNKRMEPAFVKYQTARWVLTNVLYICAIFMSFVHDRTALAICVGVMLMYLFPMRAPEYRPEESL